MARSVLVSTAETESSRIRTGASFISARAMEMRCFCPPATVTPRSPSTVPYPWLNPRTSLSTSARTAAAATWSSSGQPVVKPMFREMVSLKRKLSWGT